MNTKTKTELTQATEREYIRIYQDTTGKYSENYRMFYGNLVLENNFGLIHKIVSKFPMKNSTCTYEDLFQEGLLGLRHAITNFELDRGFRLSTYAYNWITCYVRRYYQNHGKVIRVPVHMAEKQLKLNKETEKLQATLGRTPTRDEVEALVPNAESILSSMLETVSLNQTSSCDNELEEYVGYDNTPQNDAVVDAELLMSQLKGLVSERDYGILVQRFGLDQEGVRTLKEISEQTGLTRARIHQVEKKCIATLRELASV